MWFGYFGTDDAGFFMTLVFVVGVRPWYLRHRPGLRPHGCCGRAEDLQHLDCVFMVVSARLGLLLFCFVVLFF